MLCDAKARKGQNWTELLTPGWYQSWRICGSQSKQKAPHYKASKVVCCYLHFVQCPKECPLPVSRLTVHSSFSASLPQAPSTSLLLQKSPGAKQASVSLYVPLRTSRATLQPCPRLKRWQSCAWICRSPAWQIAIPPPPPPDTPWGRKE